MNTNGKTVNVVAVHRGVFSGGHNGAGRLGEAAPHSGGTVVTAPAGLLPFVAAAVPPPA
jgi:hypothetical protein